MKLGFLGFGEAAYWMAKGLREQGKTDIAVYDKLESMPERKEHAVLMERVKNAGVSLIKDLQTMTGSVDCVISAVPAKFNGGAIREVLPFMKKGQMLVDVTTDSPSKKKEYGELCAQKGVQYVDSAMMGPLPIYKHAVPMLASGDGAERWRDTMTPFKMVIEVVGAIGGEGTRIKLARSIFTKGLEALLVETFTFAHRNGIADTVLQSLCETMDATPFAKTALRYVAGDTVHSERRKHEAEEAALAMKEGGMDPFVTEGVTKRLQRSAEQGYRDKLGGVVPGSWEEVYRLWDSTGYR